MFGRHVLEHRLVHQRFDVTRQHVLQHGLRVGFVQVIPIMPANDTASPAEGAAPEIDIAQFQTTDLRVARVLDASFVEGADKLLKLTLDVGGPQRTVFAGIRSTYDPNALVGRLVILVANLKPRKMRFGVSEGMVLAASGDAGGPFLLSPDSGAAPGMKVS